MNRVGELTQAIESMNEIIGIARDLLVVGFDPNDTETILKEQARIRKFEAERDQYITELKELSNNPTA
jgi:hypothetical protein